MDVARHKIILVDDNMANLTMGRNMLRPFYEVYPAPSAAKLFEILDYVLPDLVLLDIEMPEMNGYEAITNMKAQARLADIPVIFLTAKNDEDSELKGLDLGAVDYISKPFSGALVLKRIANQLLIVQQRREVLDSRAARKDYADNLEIKVRDKTRKVLALQNAVLTTVADLVEFRDKRTGGHINRTQRYLAALIADLVREGTYADEITAWDQTFFLASALLHDVGKIAISDLILNKPGKLTPEEFEIMKTHVTVGVEAIEKIMRNTDEHVFLRQALVVAGAHHEKWDGSGYPLGRKGRDIPLEGRLMAIADVYDALVTVRPYKRAFTHEEACNIIEAGAGTHFDSVLVQAFRRVQDEFARAVLEIDGDL
ncbi:MAG: response regulator [Deltaproteobacteria bacterium]|jgi:putative two-component system response regulator|nr:response regulator [Deltaproteobacteria bacterium]